MNQTRYKLPSQLLVISAVIVLLGDILSFWAPEILLSLFPSNYTIINSIHDWILMGWNLIVIIFAFFASLFSFNIYRKSEKGNRYYQLAIAITFCIIILIHVNDIAINIFYMIMYPYT